MRLIVKQAFITVDAENPNRQVRVELSRNGKSLSTDLKPVEADTGISNIKQSFNQKLLQKYDN